MDFELIKGKADVIAENVSKVIIGKDSEIKLILAAIIARGHVLLEDVPGTGKTVLAKSIAKSISGDFSRIQFTPDLLPSDITGMNVFSPKDQEFYFKPGPVFTNILLADELNRATPRTQSAMLEVMEERQVTTDGLTRSLDAPFLVIATQNPIETQGVFPLPEAQLDRFLMRIRMKQPTKAEAAAILERFISADPLAALEAVVLREDIVACQKAVVHCHVSTPIIEYITDIVECVRADDAVVLGISPRGMLGLMRAAQALAAISGRDFVTPDDIKAVAVQVLAHRLIIRGGYGKRDANEEYVQNILNKVPAPTEELERA